eukprot:455645-Amphidinium_carterae.1
MVSESESVVVNGSTMQVLDGLSKRLCSFSCIELKELDKNEDDVAELTPATKMQAFCRSLEMAAKTSSCGDITAPHLCVLLYVPRAPQSNVVKPHRIQNESYNKCRKSYILNKQHILRNF